MSLLAGPLFALAVLLGAAGVAKIAAPSAVRRALGTLGLPDGAGAARTLGAGEILLAAVALVYGGPLSALALAVAYGAFAISAALLVRRSGATADCGCFGATASDAPVTNWHVGVNVVAAALAAAAVPWPTDGIVEVLGEQPLGGLPFAALTLLAAWLLYACYTVLPELAEAADAVRADGEAAA